MTHLTVQQKYATPAVVRFWQQLARQGLQQAEQTMVQRYLPPQGHLLDLGCGAGRAVLALNQRGYHVTGIDLSLPMLQAGRHLSPTMALGGANLLALPFADGAFTAALMFFGALQHLPGRRRRRQALAEIARVVRPGGRLILGLDNLAPALTCYGYWLKQKIRSTATTQPPEPSQSVKPAADATLWQRQTTPLLWHGRGLLRSLRWRTWPGLVDRYRRSRPDKPDGPRPGDVNVAQFSKPATPGKIYYHIYQAGELLADAASAGWQQHAFYSGSELSQNRCDPSHIRALDKQLFFALQKK